MTPASEYFGGSGGLAWGDNVPATPPGESIPPVHIHDARVEFGSDSVRKGALFAGLEAEFAAGVFTSILGSSGVGKSSLLRLIAGLPPRRGTATGAVTDGDGKPLTGRVVYMDQRDLLLPWLSVLDNVLLGARLRGEPCQRGRALGLLAAVGLSGWEDARPDVLSGGMRQRAALARTLMEDRPIVLMDEPFSAVDAITRLTLQDLSARMLAGRTVILVTHDPIEALRLGHQVQVLAGSPAWLDPPVAPPGVPPRDPADPALVGL
ncbi:MAG: ATP-binding cassette domain-containing protein, partial [Alphaproteobacteria bacterium]|nr:ATP-binding cassette domain-containing protein [Alphaproteobacteria bacterium]